MGWRLGGIVMDVEGRIGQEECFFRRGLGWGRLKSGFS